MTSSPGTQLLSNRVSLISELFEKFVQDLHGSGHTVLVAGLQAVNDAQNLGRVAAGGGRVRKDHADLLVGVNDEHGADGKGNALGVDIGSILVVNHVVSQGNLALLVANDGKFESGVRDLVDVLDPARVAVNGVGRQTN